MKEEDLIAHLDKNPGRYVWKRGEYKGHKGIFVIDQELETETHFTSDAIEDNSLADILDATHQGRNVENITRVTGFFSKVKGWNKGKLGELKDRHRGGLE